MTDAQFADLVADFNDHAMDTLQVKAGDYATDYDRLQNFKDVARFAKVTPSVVALTYMLKHVQAISHAVVGHYDKSTWDWFLGDREGLKQRITDLINYAYLLAACMEEECSG